MEVVDVHKEGRVPEGVVILGEPVLDVGANLLSEHHALLLPVLAVVPLGQVHPGWHGAGDGEVDVNVRVGRHVLVVKGCVVLVLGLGQVECELW